MHCIALTSLILTTPLTSTSAKRSLTDTDAVLCSGNIQITELAACASSESVAPDMDIFMARASLRLTEPKSALYSVQ